MKKYLLLSVIALFGQLLPIYVSFYQGISVGLIALYVIASLIHAFSGYRLLPERYQNNRFWAECFIFCLTLSIPVLGIIGSLFSIVWAAHHPKQSESDQVEEYLIPNLPFEPKKVAASPTYSLGGLTAILKHSRESDKRLTAIMATRNMRDKEAIPILKIALRDLEDDVRLLAYSFLDKKESLLNDQIISLKKRIDAEVDDKNLWRYQRQIAEKYWELSYMGLAQGEVRQYVLKKAAELAEQSLAIKPSVATEAFLGRVYLAMKRFDEAQALFEHAAKSSLPRQHIYPYLAEIAFNKRQYALSREYMNYLPQQKMGSKLEKLKVFWNE